MGFLAIHFVRVWVFALTSPSLRGKEYSRDAVLKKETVGWLELGEPNPRGTA